MRFAHLSRLVSFGRVAVAGALCVLMADQPVFAEGMPAVTAKAPAAATQLKPDERVLHALNRLTFGPRPGDVQAVEAMGLNAWFERQLNPASIDDSALDERLAWFPAMQLPTEQLMEHYPGQQMLRAIIAGREQLPTDPTERALYKDEIAFYKKATAKREAAQAGTAPAAGMVAADGMASATATGNGLTDQNKAQDEGQDPSMASAAPAPKKLRNQRVDLLDDNPAMGAPGKKNKNDGGDEMAANAGKAMDGSAEEANLAGRGKLVHDERYFPEAKTSAILAMEPEARVQAVLALEPEQLVAFRRSLSQDEISRLGAGLTPVGRETLASLQGAERLVGGEIVQSRMLRDVYSDRQLEAVMTDFWLNHFNVYLRKNQQEPYYLPAYERDVIRPNALGNFETLLVATAKSPAMLMYLDNFQSVGPDSPAAKFAPKAAEFVKNPQVKQALKDRGLNENYARELMELHTVGVQCEVSKDRPVSMLPKSCGQGYTQADVTEVAKVLTGWTIDRPYGGKGAAAGPRAQRLAGARAMGMAQNQPQPDGSGFDYQDRRHEPGEKHVLGTTIEPAGEAEGMEVLHMLATSPATAQFISQKLAVRFVSDNPPEALVDRMAKSFLASHGDIKTVLRTMFHSPEFWSPAVYRAKVKTPEEFVISAVRASGASVANPQALVQALNQLGMGFYGMQTPNGYPWVAEPWVSTGALVSRMNFALVLSGNRLPGTRTNWDEAIGQQTNPRGIKPVSLTSVGTNPAGTEEVTAKEWTLEQMLIGQPVSDKTRETVLQQSENTTAPEQAAREFAAQGDRAMQGQEARATGSFFTGEMNHPRAAQPQDRQAAVIAGLLLGSPEFQRR